MILHSKIYGLQGQDVIIIHGLFGMGDNWATLGRRFAKYHKVHLVDLRNHGKSPHSDNFNYDVMCEDLLHYIDSHNVHDAIILGHSLGGKVAMKFAFTYPNKIAKLIVADIAPKAYSTDFHKTLLQKISRIDLTNFTKRNDVDNALSLFVGDTGMRFFLLKNLYRNESKKFAWRFNIKVLLEQISNIQEASFLHGICNVPTNFIRGGNSNYINSEDKGIIKKHFSDVSIATIDGAGHWLHAEKPEELYNEVMGFL